jgi:hypothetical protein
MTWSDSPWVVLYSIVGALLTYRGSTFRRSPGSAPERRARERNRQRAASCDVAATA